MSAESGELKYGLKCNATSECQCLLLYSTLPLTIWMAQVMYKDREQTFEKFSMIMFQINFLVYSFSSRLLWKGSMEKYVIKHVLPDVASRGMDYLCWNLMGAMCIGHITKGSSSRAWILGLARTLIVATKRAKCSADGKKLMKKPYMWCCC